MDSGARDGGDRLTSVEWSLKAFYTMFPFREFIAILILGSVVLGCLVCMR
jgi:hypothetical protein